MSRLAPVVFNLLYRRRKQIKIYQVLQGGSLVRTVTKNSAGLVLNASTANPASPLQFKDKIISRFEYSAGVNVDFRRVVVSPRCSETCKPVQGATNHLQTNTSGAVYMDAVLGRPTSKRELESAL